MTRFLVSSLIIVAINVVAAHTETPIERVSTMLTNLRSKINLEGEAEAKTYDKFACFCKDTTAAKTTAISDGESLKDTLQATINQKVSDRDTEDTTIGEKVGSIGTLEDEIAQLHAEHHNETLKYEEEEVDLTGAITALESAIQYLKATKTAVGFVQLKPVAKTVRQALLMAETLGDDLHASRSGEKVLPALLAIGNADAPEVPEEVYTFHSDEIISTLEGLKDDFKTKKEELDKAHVDAKQAHETLVLDKEQLLEQDKKALEEAKTAKAQATADIQTASSDLSTTSAQLLDDKEYLKGVSETCSEKATLWDQRTQTRSDELQALTAALEIIEDLKSGPAPAPSPALIQVKQPTAREAYRLVQVSVERHNTHASPAMSKLDLSRRARVVSLLKATASKMHSVTLLNAASSAEDDPFAKVKTMIQELIERLLKQAEDEANHKGWCDREVGLAEQTRGYKADSIKALNTELEALEARRAELGELISELTKELSGLEAQKAALTTMRASEKAENEETIKEAEEGRDAVTQAIDILDKFYKTAAKEESFVQLRRSNAAAGAPAPAAAPTPNEPIPDAGFDSAYTGAQGDSTGVIGMLEVVLGDFERTISETQADEAKAEAEFQEFLTTAGMSIAEKEEAKSARQAAKDTADAEDVAARTKLGTEQAMLDKVLGELAALDKACGGGGMTAEEKKLQREEELEALNKALCILDAHGGEGGIEDC